VHPRSLAGSVLGVSLAATAVILALDASTYGSGLHHGTGQVGSAVPGLLFTIGWIVMIIAMMLPTSIPLLRAMGRLGASAVRSGALKLQIATTAGFIAIWTLTGQVFSAADNAIHEGVGNVRWLAANDYLVGAGVLLLAGAYQFSDVKHRCLTACRTPISFVYRGWHGGRPIRDAFGIGAAYGRSCVGCCWALMLVMFALGAANPVWMFGLGGVMAIEKNTRLGDRLVAPVGVALLSSAALLVVVGR
jgi:predicted metal-binding membrane protein